MKEQQQDYAGALRMYQRALRHDPKALPVLEKVAGATRQNPARGAAERALASLRDSRKPSAELGALRSEMTEVQKENRQLRKDLDDLKKKFEALLPTHRPTPR